MIHTQNISSEVSEAMNNVLPVGNNVLPVGGLVLSSTDFFLAPKHARVNMYFSSISSQHLMLIPFHHHLLQVP